MIVVIGYEDALRATERGRWESLNDSEKTEVLQALENHVAEQEGRFPCLIEAKWLHTGDDGIELGHYSPASQHICINASQFAPDSLYGGNSDKLVETTFHEGRHAYQHQVVDGLVELADEGTAREWAENLSCGGYVTFEENPRAYWNQPVEADARQFAAQQLSRTQSERASLTESCEDSLDKARAAFASQCDSCCSIGASETAAEEKGQSQALCI